MRTRMRVRAGGAGWRAAPRPDSAPPVPAAQGRAWRRPVTPSRHGGQPQKHGGSATTRGICGHNSANLVNLGPTDAAASPQEALNSRLRRQIPYATESEINIASWWGKRE